VRAERAGASESLGRGEGFPQRFVNSCSDSGTLAGLSVTNGYDPYLRRTNLAALNSTTLLLQDIYGFDAASRLQKVTDGTNSAAYSYVANSPFVGQIAFTNNGAQRMVTTKTYDLANRLTSISSSPSAASPISFSYSYNSANQRTRTRLADGSLWNYQYDALGQVISGKKYWPDWIPVAGQQFEYGFDTIGNRFSAKAGGDETGANLRVANYSANSLNQYTSRDVPGAFDVIGLELATNSVTVNSLAPYRKGEYFRKEISVVNSSAPVWQSVTVAATSETTVTGNVFVPKTQEQFTYDLDGNLTGDGHWTYTWDGENRLTKVESLATGPTASQRRVTWEFDAKGRRIHQTTYNGSTGAYLVTEDLKLISDGWRHIAELNATNNSIIRSYIWGLDVSGTMDGAGGVGGLLLINSAANAVHFFASDGNGNVVALAKAADGTLSANYEYDPFGQAIRLTGMVAKENPFRFSTKRTDSTTDLVLYEQRPFIPSLGRWGGRDPIEERGGVSLYAFLANDAVRFSDLLGQRKFSLADMQEMLRWSLNDFHNKLVALCPSDSCTWTSGPLTEKCTHENCLAQADALTRDYANYLTTTFTTQYKRFGDVVAFTPEWDLLFESVNGRAKNAPRGGMDWHDYNAGYGLKCQGMQGLMKTRYKTLMTPLFNSGKLCFKGGEVGNNRDYKKATHHWFGIYGPSNNDFTKVDVHVDPWHSAGGIVSPTSPEFGPAQYFQLTLW